MLTSRFGCRCRANSSTQREAASHLHTLMVGELSRRAHVATPSSPCRFSLALYVCTAASSPLRIRADIFGAHRQSPRGLCWHWSTPPSRTGEVSIGAYRVFTLTRARSSAHYCRLLNKVTGSTTLTAKVRGKGSARNRRRLRAHMTSTGSACACSAQPRKSNSMR